MMKQAPTAITVADLEVVVMPNGEVLFLGRTLGWIKAMGPYLIPRDPPKVQHG
jgi:hypothetical protein